jgi:PAS domain S-box-containing protein
MMADTYADTLDNPDTPQSPCVSLEHLTDGFAALDAQGTIRFLNTAWLTMHREITGSTDAFTVGADYCACFRQACAFSTVDVPALQQGVQELLSGQRDRVDIEFACTSRAVAAPPHQRWFALTITAYPWQGQRGALVQQRDITPIKYTEERLSASESRFGAVFHDSLDVIVLGDGRDGTILNINPVVRYILGYSPADLIGQHFSILFPPEETETRRNEVLDNLRVHGAVFESQNFQHADGSLVPMDVTATMIPTTDGIAILATLRDSRERRTDELEQERIQTELERRVNQRTAELTRSEQALRQSQSFLRGFLDNSPALIFAKDTQGTYLLTNQQFDAFFDHEPGQVLGKNDHDLMPPSIAEAVRAADRRVLESDAPVQIEEVVPHGDTPRTFMTIKFPLYDTDGTRSGVGGIATDITERKHMQVALQEAQARVEHLLGVSPVVIFSSRPAGDFGATFVSSNIRGVFGYEPDEFTSNTDFWANHIHPDDAPLVFDNLSRLFEQNYHLHEYRFLHADGIYRWVENQLRLIRDETGTPLEIVGSLQDITERKNLEQEVAMQEKRLDAFFTSAPAGLALLDSQLRYKHINETAAMMNGRTVDEHLGRTVEEVLPDLGPTLKPTFEQILTEGTSLYGIEVSGETPADPGTLRHWQASYFPLYDRDERPEGIGLVFVEITERKQAEEAIRRSEEVLQRANDELEQRVKERTAQLEQANALLVQEVQERQRVEEALATQSASLARQVEEQTRDLRLANARLAHAARMKDDFLANMSHELRTPLNAILGLSEALQEQVYGPLTERQYNSLRSIEESGRHLLELINDILDLSKIESGKSELQLTNVSVENVCHASMRLLKNQAHKKRLVLTESLDSSVISLLTDERRLKQMLVNLLTNAVKFTPEGGHVGLEVVGDEEHQVVHFHVWDEGIGIAEEDMERLFKPFEQLDSGLDRQHEGTGLGLALVARLSEMHGGSVTVESTVGEGSRFTITLPWKVSQPQQQQGQDDPDTRSKQHCLWPRLLRRALVIEDSPTAAEQVTRYLNELGAETVIYTQGNSAITHARQIQPDVIILDILLPGQSGWEILQALKAGVETQHIPIVIVSVVDEQERAQDLGADNYLVKPISRQQLQLALAAIFPNQNLSQPDDAPAAPPMPDPTAATIQILIAEDNEDNIAMVSEYLTINGYQVTIARNGIEALEKVRAHRPDIILMDIQMPGMDGLEVMRHIRANQSLEGVPIIALTALAMAGDRERCLEAGADEYMSKPISLKKLRTIIETMTDNGRERHE